MKWLVCGDRNWDDRDFLFMMLDVFYREGGLEAVIEGEATGADTMAREWAESHGIPVEPHPAQWDLFGKAAGPIRNTEMLNAKPDLVIAFHDDIENSRGTKNMVEQAVRAGVETRVVRHP